MKFEDRKAEFLGKRKLIKVDETGEPIKGEPPISVKIYRDEGLVHVEGTPINAETLNVGNWRDDSSVSFAKRKDNNLPAAEEGKSQIITKMNGETWLIPPEGLGEPKKIGEELDESAFRDFIQDPIQSNEINQADRVRIVNAVQTTIAPLNSTQQSNAHSNLGLGSIATRSANEFMSSQSSTVANMQGWNKVLEWTVSSDHQERVGILYIESSGASVENFSTGILGVNFRRREYHADDRNSIVLNWLTPAVGAINPDNFVGVRILIPPSTIRYELWLNNRFVTGSGWNVNSVGAFTRRGVSMSDVVFFQNPAPQATLPAGMQFTSVPFTTVADVVSASLSPNRAFRIDASNHNLTTLPGAQIGDLVVQGSNTARTSCFGVDIPANMLGRVWQITGENSMVEIPTEPVGASATRRTVDNVPGYDNTLYLKCNDSDWTTHDHMNMNFPGLQDGDWIMQASAHDRGNLLNIVDYAGGAILSTNTGGGGTQQRLQRGSMQRVISRAQRTAARVLGFNTPTVFERFFGQCAFMTFGQSRGTVAEGNHGRHDSIVDVRASANPAGTVVDLSARLYRTTRANSLANNLGDYVAAIIDTGSAAADRGRCQIAITPEGIKFRSRPVNDRPTQFLATDPWEDLTLKSDVEKMILGAGNGASGVTLVAAGTAGSPPTNAGNATTAARSDHTHNAANVGALPITGGTLTGNLTVNGAISATGNINAGSDRKWKSNIKPIEHKSVCEFVENLNVCAYDFKHDDAEESEKMIGVIAQELQGRNIDGFGFVTEREDGLYIKESKLIYALIAHNQELSKRLKILEEKVYGVSSK